MLSRTLIVGSILLALVLLAVLVPLLRDPAGARRLVLSLFRRPEGKPKAPGTEHYYRPYWS